MKNKTLDNTDIAYFSNGSDVGSQRIVRTWHSNRKDWKINEPGYVYELEYFDFLYRGDTTPKWIFKDHTAKFEYAQKWAEHYHIELEPEKLEVPTFILPFKPSDSEIYDACLYFRHDFGLMDDGPDRHLLIRDAINWLEAWSKVIGGK